MMCKKKFDAWRNTLIKKYKIDSSNFVFYIYYKHINIFFNKILVFYVVQIIPYTKLLNRSTHIV